MKLLLLLPVLVLAKPRNFIMVIPDGFGPQSETMARDYAHWKDNSTTFLPIDEMVIGLVRTRSTDSYVTDSASSATAYSAGIKTYNAAIGVDVSGAPVGNVLEAAKLQGYKTGLIVTSRITHATPASFGSHVVHRDLEPSIALQEIGYAHPFGRIVDILLGGGRCFFTPAGTAGSCRKDNIDALALAEGLGYTVFSDRATFDKDLELPYLGLFTQDHMSYEVDRDPAVEPSLKEMAMKGLNDLYAASKDSEKGFFVMVEASRIDHAGHANDAVGHLFDILAFNEAMLAMREWIDEHPDSDTMLISTADHECGGLTVGTASTGQPYQPGYFATSKNTAGVLSYRWRDYAGADQEAYLRKDILERHGVTNPTAAEIATAVSLKSNRSGFESWLSKTLSARAGVNWSTGDHTAGDVTLHGWGKGAKEFAGGRENNEVGKFIAEQLDLDLEDVTKRLLANATYLNQYVKPAGAAALLAQKRGIALAHSHN